LEEATIAKAIPAVPAADAWGILFNSNIQAEKTNPF
jgi:hypothetical protein